MKNITLFVLVIIMIVGIIYEVTSKSWTLRSDGDHWVPVCVYGQLTYHTRFNNAAVVVNAIDENNNSIRCEVINN